MSFIVSCFHGEFSIDSLEQLDVVLSLRDQNNANAFWLSHNGKNGYPAIHMLVMDNLAVLHFYAIDGDVGSRSIGEGLTGTMIDPDGDTVFYLTSGGEEVAIWNDMVLPIETALTATKEFFKSCSKPVSINWENL